MPVNEAEVATRGIEGVRKAVRQRMTEQCDDETS